MSVLFIMVGASAPASLEAGGHARPWHLSKDAWLRFQKLETSRTSSMNMEGPGSSSVEWKCGETPGMQLAIDLGFGECVSGAEVKLYVDLEIEESVTTSFPAAAPAAQSGRNRLLSGEEPKQLPCVQSLQVSSSDDVLSNFHDVESDENHSVLEEEPRQVSGIQSFRSNGINLLSGEELQQVSGVEKSFQLIRNLSNVETFKNITNLPVGGDGQQAIACIGDPCAEDEFCDHLLDDNEVCLPSYGRCEMICGDPAALDQSKAVRNDQAPRDKSKAGTIDQALLRNQSKVSSDEMAPIHDLRKSISFDQALLENQSKTTSVDTPPDYQKDSPECRIIVQAGLEDEECGMVIDGSGVDGEGCGVVVDGSRVENEDSGMVIDGSGGEDGDLSIVSKDWEDCGPQVVKEPLRNDPPFLDQEGCGPCGDKQPLSGDLPSHQGNGQECAIDDLSSEEQEEESGQWPWPEWGDPLPPEEFCDEDNPVEDVAIAKKVTISDVVTFVRAPPIQEWEKENFSTSEASDLNADLDNDSVGTTNGCLDTHVSSLHRPTTENDRQDMTAACQLLILSNVADPRDSGKRHRVEKTNVAEGGSRSDEYDPASELERLSVLVEKLCGDLPQLSVPATWQRRDFWTIEISQDSLKFKMKRIKTNSRQSLSSNAEDLDLNIDLYGEVLVRPPRKQQYKSLRTLL